MINRVLIRMKAVQLLYSYLLVEKPFNLESLPGRTKENKFAHGLYLDLILLMDRLAHRVMGKNKSYPLAVTKFILRTENDDYIRGLRGKYSEEPFPFSPVETALAEEIKGSLLFKEFEKRREAGESDDKFWENVFKAIIIVNPKVNEIIQSLPNYTLSGMERMSNLMEETFKNYYSSHDNVDDALRTLDKSLHEARELYMRLLDLPVELTALRMEQLELNRRKILATVQDLNPNMKFVENQVPKLIERNEDFRKYVEKHHVSWRAEDPELLTLLLRDIINSEVYQNYAEEGSLVQTGQKGLQEDVEFWKNVYVEVILQDANFLEYLENKSVFWNDDLEIMMSFVLKTIKKLERVDKQAEAVMPMYKDGENGKDAKFGAELFNYVVKNKDLYRHYIQTALQQDKWDSERLAFMDVIITMTAIAELLNYPEIPVSVTVNEYIEIAKSYSSAKSGQFVHGLLASLIDYFREQGILQK